MPHPHLNWLPGSKQPAAVANVRVCLALLRVYRYVPLPHDVNDLSAVARCFWPLVRLFPELLESALSARPILASTLGRSRRYSDDALLSNVEHWKDLLSRGRKRLPIEPGDDWVLEALGEGLVHHTPSFTPLFAAIERKLEDLAQSLKTPADLKLDLLSSLVQLSPDETAFLRLCVATASSSIGGAFFSVARHPVRLIQAVQKAIGAKLEHDVSAMLRRNSRLVRSGLVDNDAFSLRNDMEDVLRLSRLAMLILGSRAKDIQGMADVVLRRTQAATQESLEWPHLEQRTSLLHGVMSRALQQSTNGVNVLLYGAPGTGKTQYANRLVSGLHAEAFSVSDTDSDGDPARRADRLSSLILTQLFAPAQRSVVILDEAEDIFQNDYNDPMARAFGKREDNKSWMNHLLEQNKHPVIWISNRIGHIDPAYLRRFTYCLEFPRTPQNVRRTIARTHLGPVGCSASFMDTVAAEVDISPALLASAARFTQLSGTQGDQADRTVKTVLDDMVKAIGGKFGGRVPERSTRFDLQYLNAKGAVTPSDLLEGIGRMGRGRLLLSGPPGTGKTQLAAEIAMRLGRELVYRTGSDINSMWFGQSERNVAKMFQECDTSGEVLFLDEADTLMAARDSSGQRAEVAVTAEFLRQIEAFTGVFVCATNFQSRLDAALLRRFEFRLEMLPLSGAQRLSLFQETALGWDPASSQPVPQIDAAVQRRLDALHLLTPGDFANVVRRVRSLQLTLDAQGWLEELDTEQRAKPDAARSTSMGFL